MGAEYFEIKVKGATAREAYRSAVEQAIWDWGHQGYSGTIKETDGFKEFNLNGKTVEDRIREIDQSGAIDDKWGPCGCIKVDGDAYVFFGWASS